MNIEKIEINGHYVWVDKDADIEQSEYLYDKNFGISKARWSVINSVAKNDQWKIIAASPEFNLEGVPTYVEWLAEKEYPIKIQSVMEGSEDVNRFERDAFIKGYQAAEKELSDELLTKYQEGMAKGLKLCQELYTENDVRKAIAMARETEYGLIKSKEEIIEQLKQSKK